MTSSLSIALYPGVQGGAKEKNAWYILFAHSFNFRDLSRKIRYYSNPPHNVDACNLEPLSRTTKCLR